MNDYSELKRLAGGALRNWPDSKIFERPECEQFIDASRPDVVLDLIAEIERLEEDLNKTELRALKFIHQCSAHVDLYRELRTERDKLKSELEACKADAERYQFARKLNPNQFGQIWQENITTGKPFDLLIDEARTVDGKDG